MATSGERREFSFTNWRHPLCPQLKQPDKAAAAAHTYFQANPEHVEMGQNLEQYKDLQGVREEHFVDREARPHQVGHHLFQSRSSLVSTFFLAVATTGFPLGLEKCSSFNHSLIFMTGKLFKHL